MRGGKKEISTPRGGKEIVSKRGASMDQRTWVAISWGERKCRNGGDAATEEARDSSC